MLDKHSVLVALGPGGTTELAERALALVQSAPVPEMGGLTEVARTLGVSRQILGHWIAGRRGPGTFPRPFQELAATPVWILREVIQWKLDNPELFPDLLGAGNCG